MEVIHSKENALIKQVKKLKEKKYRIQNSSFIVEGFRFVEEALKSNFEVPYIFISEEMLCESEAIRVLALVKEFSKTYVINNQILKDICCTENPQGILAVAKVKTMEVINSNGFYILADRIQDPGNMGTIIRTAHAAGASGLIVTKGSVDVYNEKTLRATMGSIFHLPLIEDNNLTVIKELKEKGFSIIVSSLDTDNNFFDVELNKKVVLCVGNEGNGISSEIMSLADIKLKIPMPGGAESLNASVAASIMIYEIVRQKMLK